MSRKPPFDQTGSGYRDTLTWMTCVDLAADGGDVYLVSQDKDFAGRDLPLAPELAEEVAELPGSVTLVRHLGRRLTPLVPWRDVTDPREAAAQPGTRRSPRSSRPGTCSMPRTSPRRSFGLPPGATIHDISYHGSGQLKRVRHDRHADGADRVVYEFPIEFEVDLSLSTVEAREAGFIQHEGSATGVEVITTVVPMTGVMTVVHNEWDPESPLYFDHIDFRLEGVDMPGARVDDPNQLRLPPGPASRASPPEHGRPRPTSHEAAAGR